MTWVTGQGFSAPEGVGVPLLSVADLIVKFGTRAGYVHAVNGVDFAIGRGETVGLVGESGCGKSTVARALMRLNPGEPACLTEGTVTFRPRGICDVCLGSGCSACGQAGKVTTKCSSCDGAGCAQCDGTGVATVDLLKLDDGEMRAIRGNSIAMVFQDPGKALNPTMTIRDQFTEVFTQHRSDQLMRECGLDDPDRLRLIRRAASGKSGAAERFALRLPPWRNRNRRLQMSIDDRIARALEQTRIPKPRKVMYRYPHELSGGMKQRVMIAMALACRPELIIADEPTTALDVTTEVRILDLLNQLQKELGVAVLYISHDLGVVRKVSHRVLVMYAGRVVEMGPTERVFREPKHPYTRGVLDATPSAHQARGTLRAIEGTVPELLDPKPSCPFSSRCPHAHDPCFNTTPQLLDVGGVGHQVACFLYTESGASGELNQREGAES